MGRFENSVVCSPYYLPSWKITIWSGRCGKIDSITINSNYFSYKQFYTRSVLKPRLLLKGKKMITTTLEKEANYIAYFPHYLNNNLLSAVTWWKLNCHLPGGHWIFYKKNMRGLKCGKMRFVSLQIAYVMHGGFPWLWHNASSSRIKVLIHFTFLTLFTQGSILRGHYPCNSPWEPTTMETGWSPDN